MKVREEAGHGYVEGATLLRAPLDDGAWGQSPMPVSEAADWLRRMLNACEIRRGESGLIATHSLKATLLSWLAKYGTPVELALLHISQPPRPY